ELMPEPAWLPPIWCMRMLLHLGKRGSRLWGVRLIARTKLCLLPHPERGLSAVYSPERSAGKGAVPLDILWRPRATGCILSYVSRGRSMTSDSGNGAPRWDQARIALGRVAELFNNNEYDSTTVEELRR